MASIKAVTIAGLMAMGACTTARAADLPLPSPPPIEMPPPPVASGWYLRGDVGYGFDQVGHFRSSNADPNSPDFIPGFAYGGSHLDGHASFGGGVGYQINPWFRVDVTGEYHTPSNFSATESASLGGATYASLYNGSVRSSVFLANAYVDLGTWYGITPFIGAGIGGAWNQLHDMTEIGLPGYANSGAYGYAPDHSEFNLAWAVMAGVSYPIAPNWKLEVSYRYLDSGTLWGNNYLCGTGTTNCNEVQHFHLTSHDVRIGLRYMFAEIPPIAPALPPVVAKY